MRTLARIETIGLGLLLAACVPYRAAPIDPARSEATFTDRTLDDAEFSAWARSELGTERDFPPRAWDLESLSLAAFWFHPDLDVARLEARSAGARVETASTRPNPTLAFRPEYVTNAAAGDSSWVADLGLDFPVETGGKRDLRTERAKKLALAAEVGVYEVAWRVRAGVRTALQDRLAAAREVGALATEIESRREIVRLLDARFRAGDVAHTEVARAEIELARTEMESKAAATRFEETTVALAAAVGVSAPALALVALDDPPLAAPTPEIADAAAESARAPGLVERFDVRRSLLEYDAAEADVRLEIARQVPDLTLGPGYAYDQGLSKLAFSFALPLALFDRNRGPIAEAEGRRAEAQAHFLSLQARAIGEIESGRARYRGAIAELDEARALAGRQRDAAQAIEHAFAAGGADRLDVAIARAETAALARGELAARRRAEAALGDLEDAVQRPLAGGRAVPGRLPRRSTEPGSEGTAR